MPPVRLPRREEGRPRMFLWIPVDRPVVACGETPQPHFCVSPKNVAEPSRLWSRTSWIGPLNQPVVVCGETPQPSRFRGSVPPSRIRGMAEPYRLWPAPPERLNRRPRQINRRR